MSERNWEEASEDDLQDGIDDGESDAIAEYSSRLYRRLERAEGLLKRWESHARDGHMLDSLAYETRGFFGDPNKIP